MALKVHARRAGRGPVGTVRKLMGMPGCGTGSTLGGLATRQPFTSGVSAPALERRWGR